MIASFLTGSDGFRISYAYFPVKNSSALIQLVHGSMEHKERYYDLIQFLNQKGYSCIISDNRGHGLSVSRKYPYGHMENPDDTISDLKIVTDYIRVQEPGKKLILFGHSMGSLYVRNYLKYYDDLIDVLIVCGTVCPNHMAGFGVGLSKFLSWVTGGSYGRSRILLNLIGLGRPAEEWISYNKQNLLNTADDPLMAVRFDNGGVLTTITMVRDLSKPEKYQKKNPGLPILSICGEDDPVTGLEKGVNASIQALKAIGYQNIYSKRYPHMMHEILNEDGHCKVYEDIVSFCNMVVAGMSEGDTR